MIFVTIGTTPFPFLRMRDLVKKIVENQKRKEEVIFQHGATPNVAHKAVKNFFSLSYPRMKTYMANARVIVCHGGPATIFQAIESGKIPYVLPRKKEFGEHVDDHQVYFSEFMEKQDFIHTPATVENILNSKARKIRKTTHVSRSLLVCLSGLLEN